MISEEQIAHDLAVAVAAAKLSKKKHPQADASVLNDYRIAKRNLEIILKDEHQR